MKKKWLIAVASVLILGLSALGVQGLMWSTPVDSTPNEVTTDLVELGKQALYAQNILLAKEKFLAAVTADSANQEAQFFLGVARIAALYEEGQNVNTSALDSIKEIATQFGFTVNSFGLYNTSATSPAEMPSDMPRTGAVFAFVANKMMPEIDAALQNFEKVTSSGFSSTLRPSALASTGNSYTIDYADVLTLKTLVYAAKATAQLTLAYNWDVHVPSIISADPKDLQDVRKLLVDHPLFGTAQEPARLTSAKAALHSFIVTFNQASTQIGLRSGESAHLFVLDAPVTNELAALEAASLNEFKAALAEIDLSLSGPHNFGTADSSRTVDLSKLFNSASPINIRKKILDTSTNNVFSDTTFGGIFPQGIISPELEKKAAAAEYELTWKQTSAQSGLMDVAYNGSIYVALGSEPTIDQNGLNIGSYITTSPDGTTWTRLQNVPGSSQIFKVKLVGNKFVAMGSKSNFPYGMVFLTSSDGVNWIDQSPTDQSYFNDMAWGNNTFVRVGNTIESSPDGVNWTNRYNVADNNFSSIIWAGNKFVAIGSSQTYNNTTQQYEYSSLVLTSPDGVNWTTQNTNLLNVDAGMLYFGNHIAWSGSRLALIALEFDESMYQMISSVYTSPDGVTWTKRAGRTANMFSGDSSIFSSVYWIAGKFVVAGGNSLLTSPDGVTWTEKSFLSGNLKLNAFADANGKLLAVGSNGVYLQTGAPTSVATPVHGACGGSNTGTFSIVPATDLCSAGTASAVTKTGTWNWSCAGSNGGIAATCNANIQTWEITANVIGGNGTVTCTSPIKSGLTSSCRVTPLTGYQLATLTDNTVDKKPSVISSIYNIVNVTDNHTIEATFRDALKPALTSFTIPLTGTSPTVYFSTLNATDNVAVTGYLLTESATIPAVEAAGWSATKPTSYTFTGILDGSPTLKTLYAWAKDAAGNVSNIKSALIMITQDSTKPVVNDFALPETSASLTVAIPTFTATDSVAVTGYLVTESATVPTAAASAGWSSAKPISYTFASEGSKVLYAWTKDGAGNISDSLNAAVIIDATAPALTVSTLGNGSYTNTASLNIVGAATDSSGIKSVTVNNKLVTLDQNGIFSTLITLTEGPNEISIIASDNGNNTTSISRSVTYDKTRPKLTVTAPADNSVMIASNVYVSGVIDENSTVKLVVNGGSPQDAQINSTEYSATVNLNAGSNEINITATDLAGNSSSIIRNIISDYVNPELSITEPPQGQVTRDGNVTISGTVGAPSDVTVKVSSNGTDYYPAVTTGSFTQTLIFTEEKLHQITVTATDQSGFTTTVVRNIYYSKGQISFRGNSGHTNSTTVTLDLGYYPETPHVATKMQFFYNTTWTAPEVYSATKQIILPAVNGKKDVTVRFFDETGAPSIDYSASIILDTTAPVGGITIENGAPQTKNTTLHLSLFATDINGVTNMRFREYGATWGSEETFRTSYDYPLTSTVNGTKIIYVQFKDASGKWSGVYSDSIILNSGLLAPPVTNGNITVTSAKPADPTGYTTVPAVKLALESIDSYMSFSTNGVTWSRWELSRPYKNLALPGGSGTKTVYARFAPVYAPKPDQISDTIYSGSIILDTIAPIGKILINDGAKVTNNRTVDLVLEASDMNGIVGMYVTYDPAIPAVFEQFKTVKTIDLPAVNGVKYVKVVYVDAAGKKSIAYSDTIILDTIAPTGTVRATRILGAVSPNPNVLLTLAASGAVAMQVSLDDGANWGNWEPYVTSKKVILTVGPQSVKAKFRDLAGNESDPVSAMITVP